MTSQEFKNRFVSLPIEIACGFGSVATVLALLISANELPSDRFFLPIIGAVFLGSNAAYLHERRTFKKKD